MGRSAAVRRLATARDQFCGVGTRRTKLQLNKLAEANTRARAMRIALEIEDASTLGKKYGFSKWGYRSYERKHALIHELIEICRQEGWEYGKHQNHTFGPKWIIYFHLPGCEQISFHTDLEDDTCIPDYRGEWDGLEGSTIGKLEAAVLEILKEAQMPRGEIRDEAGKVLGYVEGCSRGSTGPLCKFCKNGKGEKRCDYKLRGGRSCNVYICTRCAAHRDPDEDFCPDHRERAGLGPPPSVVRHRERRAAAATRKAARLNAPPRWIEHSYRPDRCRECHAGTKAGDRILYFSDRTVMCANCGGQYVHQC